MCKSRDQKTEYYELNKNEYTAFQNLWQTGKTVLRGIFIGLEMSKLKKRRGLKLLISASVLRKLKK